MPLTALKQAEIQALLDEGAEYVVPPEQFPLELLKIATNRSEYPETRQEKGLILTTEAILSIKTYEKDGLALPDTENEVYTYLGQTNSDVPGLTNADLLISFLAVRDNARTWAPLQEGIIATAAKLDAFAVIVNSNGQSAYNFLEQIVIKYINDPEFINLDPDRLGDEEYIQEILENLDTEADVASEEAGKLALTKAFIDNLVNQTIIYKNDTEQLLADIITFKRGLTECSDDLRSKDQLCDQLDLEAELEAKKEEVRQLKARLEDLNRQYDKFVGLAFTGAVGGPIGIAITGGIFGSRAEDTRKEIKEVKAEINALEAEIESLSRLITAISTLDTTFEDLSSVMHQAEKGVEDLVTVWTSIYELLKASSDQCEQITNAESVLLLLAPFNAAIAPWSEIGDMAKEVSQQFQDALDQWQQGQQNS